MDNVELSQVDRRLDQRIELEQEPLRLSWTDTAGKSHAIDAMCIDMSRRGMLIQLSDQVTMGTKVNVRFLSKQADCDPLEAKVSRCHRKNFTTYHVFLLTK
ncbi:PilZ domain-containing protein [Aliagarivorans taiwanensis]|uniref:PilZ domain-containing protein n=1 Tax=Aliagarivorans taiwanensis TaxID=561966 RepID=UPI0004225FB7|nr:PilZ domain-containing protein [Aliagarivorans taiwanensis]